MSKSMLPILLALFCLLPIRNLDAELVPVFLAAGQSNAKPAWSNAIESELRDIYDTNTVVVNSIHDGDWLDQWMDNGVSQQDYIDDSAAVSSRLQSIVANGDTPLVRGLFWFQGEGDTGSDLAMDLYTSRFKDMIDRYETDFSTSLFKTVMVIDATMEFSGRTFEDINRMRSIQFELGNATDSVAVDTRDYERLDVLHITTPELQRLGRNSASAFVIASSVPEPSSTVVVALAFLGLAGSRRKRTTAVK